jgi:hypothetical protein
MDHAPAFALQTTVDNPIATANILITEIAAIAQCVDPFTSQGPQQGV